MRNERGACGARQMQVFTKIDRPSRAIDQPTIAYPFGQLPATSRAPEQQGGKNRHPKQKPEQVGIEGQIKKIKRQGDAKRRGPAKRREVQAALANRKSA